MRTLILAVVVAAVLTIGLGECFAQIADYNEGDLWVKAQVANKTKVANPTTPTPKVVGKGMRPNRTVTLQKRGTAKVNSRVRNAGAVAWYLDKGHAPSLRGALREAFDW